MVEINPTLIPGSWTEGFALDVHTVNSIYVGDDQFGHPQFNTERSPLGELIFRLKNRNDQSGISEIVDTAQHFIVETWGSKPDLLTSTPPSRPRTVQPLHLIAERLAIALDVAFEKDAVRLVKDLPELKNVFDFNERTRLLDGAHIANPNLVRDKAVLLIDDLYRSGATMEAVTRSLRAAGAEAVLALAFTKTRTRR